MASAPRGTSPPNRSVNNAVVSEILLKVHGPNALLAEKGEAEKRRIWQIAERARLWLVDGIAETLRTFSVPAVMSTIWA